MSRRLQYGAAAALALAAGLAAGIESDPLPEPSNAPAANANRLYNDGVALLVTRDFGAAQAKFEAALALNEKLPEAHNNLAYALRMQGPQNFAASLAHYNRALELNPELAQAYAYRGMLFKQQGDMVRARQDLARLKTLHPRLADDLEKALDGHASRDTGGISAQYE